MYLKKRDYNRRAEVLRKTLCPWISTDDGTHKVQRQAQNFPKVKPGIQSQEGKKSSEFQG